MALILLLMIQIFVSISVMAADQQLCPHIFIHNDKFTLNKNEKIIICGDDREAEWKEIPLEQAQVELKGLFQKQGYFNSQFTRKGDDLWIEMGPQTKIDNWILTSNNTVVDSERKRKVRGQPMTPTKLDEIENWIEGELKARGYACPLISSKAQVWDSSVVSHYQTGKKLNITSLQRKGLENLDEEAFRRFDAFEVQDVYNNRKLQLTSNRLLNDGLTQSSYFTQVCTETGVDLIHHLELGEPRILRIGFGASSEELPFLDAWFKNTRIDNRASSYWLLLHASPRIQSLEGSSQLYWIPASKRTYLGPRFKVARNVEDTYENLSGKTGLDIGRLWDAWDNRFDMRAGPTLNYINTIRGFGPDDVSYFTVDGNINVMNNKYELTGAQQFEGTQSSLQYQGQRKGLGSPLNADRWTFRAKNLWNINELAPPYVVL
ncbi:MAG: hypothetical protein ACXWC9_10145, partial [Pseudobdellovibrionaceae bacterium]